MRVGYNKLWKLLVDRSMSNAELRRQSGITAYTLTKMKKGEPVSLIQLSLICETLKVDFGDIIEFIKE